MDNLRVAWQALESGGPMVYPLLLLGALAILIVLDRAAAYLKLLRMPVALDALTDSFDFTWDALHAELATLDPRNAYARFLSVIAGHRERPIWWIESRACEESGTIEKSLSRGLWLLETVITAAPLLGLLGTITGMMEAFRIIGGTGLVAPTEVTGGVAQALIATALGLLIAVVALCAFNWFERMRSQALDQMERLGTRLIDRIRLDLEPKEHRHEAA